MTSDVLLIAGAEERDPALLAAAAHHRPTHLTIVLDDPAAGGGWFADDSAAGVARRERLAGLLTAAERATGALVLGTVGDAARLDRADYDAVLGAERAPALAAA